MRRVLYALLATTAVVCASGPVRADTKDMRIAFSNNYAGNSWRQAMLKSYAAVADKAVQDKIIGAADVFTTADKEVPTQAAQLQNLVLQGYNAIVINAASPDALNGAVKQACDAGIVVVSFDGIVTEPCAYRVRSSISRPWASQGQVDVSLRPSNCRRAATCSRSAVSPAPRSTTRFPQWHRWRAVKKNPQFKIANTVEGDWDETTAQKAVVDRSALPARHRRVWWTRAATAMAPRRRSRTAGRPAADHHHGQPPGRVGSGGSAAEEAANGYDHLVGVHRTRCVLAWPSGSPSRSWTAARTSRTTSWFLIWNSPRTISKPRCPKFPVGGVASASNIQLRMTPRRSSPTISSK